MNLYKRLVSMVVALCICTSYLTIHISPMENVSAAESVSAPKILFSDDFNSYVVGQMPPASVISTYNSKGNYMGIDNVPSIRDKSIKMEVKSRDDFLFHTKSYMPGVKGKFVFEMDIRIDNPGGCVENFWVYQDTETDPSVTGTWMLFSINANNQILVNGINSGFMLPEGKFTTLSFAIDLDKQLVSMYVNYKLRAAGVKIPTNAVNMSFVRAHITGVVEGCTNITYFDNLKIYEGEEALSPEQFAKVDWNIGGDISEEIVEAYMTNKLGFYVNSSNYYIDGKIQKMDGTGTVTAIEKNGKTYIPVKYGAEAFGGKALWDGESGTTTVEIGENVVTISSDTYDVVVNGEKKQGNEDAFLESGRTYLSSELFSEVSGKNLFEETGIIVFSDINVDYDWYDDVDIIKELTAAMCFDRPDGSKIENDLRKIYNPGEHPRIWATKADFERIRNEISTSQIKKEWFDKIKNYTENVEMKYKFDDYGTTDGIRMRVQCERVKDIVGWCGFLWQVTGDDKYAQHAWKCVEKMGIGSYPDWNHQRHWLDTGTFLIAYGLAYDWLYDWMNDEQRKLVRDSIVKFGFEEYIKSRFYNTPGTDNWNSVIAAGNIISALAIMDEEPEISKTVITDAVRNIEATILSLAPDGACFEGPSYWQLVMESCIEGVWALQTAAGSCYGLSNSPGFAEAAYFPFALAGKQTLNFGNAGALLVSTLDSKDLFWLANINDDDNLRNFRYKLMLDNNITPNYREMISCVGDPGIVTSELDIDKYYRVVETAAIRSSWDAETMFFGGLHGGKTTQANGQLDTGTFYIDSFGDRFACDLGIENYNLPGNYNDKYRNRGEGHNIMIFNPDDREADINEAGFAKFERFESNKVSAIMSTDITCNYTDYVDSAIRAMRFVNGRTSIILQDEVKSQNSNEVYWFMHTQADVTISEDGKTAILDINGNRLEAKILSDVGSFGVMDAKPLPTSPQVTGQNENKGFQKLFIHLEDVKDFTLSICFTPLVYTPVGGEIKYPEVTPIEEWVLEDPDKVSLGVLPKLSELSINGKEVAGFNSNRNFYAVALKNDSSTIPDIAASGDGDVRIIYPEQWPGNVEVRISNGVFENVYGIRFNVLPQSLADKGYVELDIHEYSVSSVPQKENGPENAFDNDLETRYSVQHPGWICLDLGEAKSVYYVSLAFYLGDTRMNEFIIEVSEDGKTWTKVWQGRDSGITEELQNFDIGGVNARYIRVTGTGIVNPGTDVATEGWFSPLEVKCYTK